MRFWMPLQPKRGRDRTAVLAGALVLIAMLCPRVAYPLVVRESAWVPDGEVRAIAYSGSTLYIGGAFSQVGPASGPAVAIDAAAVAQKPYPRVVGNVRAVEPDGSGGWYVGGAFTMVQGRPRNNLAHIDASGSVTSWNPNVNGEVDDIALGGGVVYIGGTFSSVGGSSRSYIAAIDVVNGLATSWASTLAPDGPVSEVEWTGSSIYLGGTFNLISGSPRECLAEINAAGGLTGFNAGSGSGLTNVNALEFSSGKLFITVTSTFAYALKVFDVTAGYLPYNVFANGIIDDVAFDPSSGLAYVCGTFSNIGGQARLYLAAIQVDTGVVTAWSATADGPPRTVALAQGPVLQGLLVGGFFTTIAGASRKGLALVDLASSSALGWSPNCGGEVHAVEFDGTRVYAGGDFSIINGVARSNAAAIDTTTGSLLAWNPATDAAVEALTVSGGKVYIGGQFSSVGGLPRSRAASVDRVTGAVSGFDPNVELGITTVRAFAVVGNTVYMAGAFSTVGGQPRGSLAAVDTTSGSLLPWNPAANGSVLALRVIVPINLNPPTVIVGGQFTMVGGQFRNNLASLTGDTGLANSWNPNVSGSVQSLVVFQNQSGNISKVYAGGALSAVGGQPRNCIAAIDGSGAPLAWAPNPNGVVYSIATFGNSVFVGGGFTSVGGQARNHVAEIDATTGLATTWDPNALGGVPPGYVYALLKLDHTIYAGGSFTTIAGTGHSYLAGVMDPTVTAVESDPAATSPRALRAAPNPFGSGTQIHFSLPSEGRTSVIVYDVAGRRIRDLHDGWLGSGRQTIPWDGCDDAGRSVGAGVYFVAVKSPVGHLGLKLHRVR